MVGGWPQPVFPLRSGWHQQRLSARSGVWWHLPGFAGARGSRRPRSYEPRAIGCARRAGDGLHRLPTRNLLARSSSRRRLPGRQEHRRSSGAGVRWAAAREPRGGRAHSRLERQFRLAGCGHAGGADVSRKLVSGVDRTTVPELRRGTVRDIHSRRRLAALQRHARRTQARDDGPVRQPSQRSGARAAVPQSGAALELGRRRGAAAVDSLAAAPAPDRT